MSYDSQNKEFFKVLIEAILSNMPFQFFEELLDWVLPGGVFQKFVFNL